MLDFLRKTSLYRAYNRLHYKMIIYRMPQQRDKIKELYHASNSYAEMVKLKDIHKGKRCFLIGNGPSLTNEDLNRLKDEITFSSNKIYKALDNTEWRPYYYVVDDAGYVKKDYNNIVKVPSKKTFVCFENQISLFKKYGKSNVLTIPKVSKIIHNLPTMSEDFTEYLGAGYTVMVPAFQLAVHMGIKEIYLIGTDCNYDNVSNWFYASDNKKQVSLGDALSVFNGFDAISLYAKENGIKVYNATKGGKLEVFERVNFDDII